MNKRVLVTAGNTSVPIEKVRSIGNIFSGRTGTRIAEYFVSRGCQDLIKTMNKGPLDSSSGPF
jgi:phosphopantothenoylcysteine synthetase/decarboxylase